MVGVGKYLQYISIGTTFNQLVELKAKAILFSKLSLVQILHLPSATRAKKCPEYSEGIRRSDRNIYKSVS